MTPLRRLGIPTMTGILAAIVCVPGPAALQEPAARRGLTEAAALAEVYDLVVNARFDEADTRLRQLAGRAPAEACQVLRVVGLWWRILLDPENRALDARFRSEADAAIAAAEAWALREPRRAEVRFYLGGAYAARVQWRVQRGERLAAARDGKRIKDSLERALELDPQLADAYFGIGLYHYYADVAPMAAKILRWFLLLPGGDRVAGLKEMLQARDRGQLVRSEADYQLHLLYLWYEGQADEALALLNGLQTRHPDSPLFPARIASVQDVYFHDAAASLETYQGLFAAAAGARMQFPELAVAEARLGMAIERDALYESDRAVEQLRTLVAAKPGAPFDCAPRAELQLGLSLDRLGQRSEALAAYRAATAGVSPNDPFNVRGRVRDAMRRTPDARIAEAYRLSLEGWRLLERGALGDADRALSRAISLNPSDPVIRFRHARLLEARGDSAGALVEFRQVIRARSSVAPTFLAAAYLHAARALEATNRPEAIELYATAGRVRGADRMTRESAANALARLRATTPRS